MGYDITPNSSKRFLESDLVKYFADTILKNSSAQNFSDGSVSAPAGTVPLFPGVLQDDPDDCGYVMVQERPAEANNPVTTADLTVVFRAKKDASYTAQQKAHQMASVLRNFLHASGFNLTNVALPSGRYVQAFTQVTHLSLGLDMKNRFRTSVTSQLILRGDDEI